MHRKARLVLYFVFACSFISLTGAGKHIRNKHNKYSISFPDAMMKVDDTGTDDGEVYYDTAAKIVMMITERKSKFHSVKEYIDCSQKELETLLRGYYADSTLRLVNCSISPYYPKESTVILFHVGVLPYGFNTCLVYFVHHKHRDLQFSFTYDEEPGRRQGEYINTVMKTLELK